MKLRLQEPVVVAQAPPEVRGWGPWQFPGIQRLPDGRLAVTYHVEADSAVAYGKLPGVAVSADEGRTWQPADAGGEAGAWTSRILRLPDGDLLRQVRLRSMDPEPVRHRLPPALGQTRGGYNHPLTVFEASRFPPDLAGYRFARLRPGAATWVEETAAVNLPGALRAVYMGVLTFPWMQRLAVAPDGSLWGIGHGKRLVDGRIPEQHGAQFLRSVDGGRTWDLLGEIPYQPEAQADPHAGCRDGFTEPNVAFLPDGSVLCLLRTTDANGVGPLYSSRSADGGRTWTRPEVFDDLGVWPALVTLGKGVTVAAYGRPGLYTRATADPTGRDWGERLAVVEPGPLQNDTCSYADLLATGEGEALIAYSHFSWPDAAGTPRKTILVRRLAAS
ncbi:MAG: sialidase family protein [Gemmatimonadota bacterium]